MQSIEGLSQRQVETSLFDDDHRRVISETVKKQHGSQDRKKVDLLVNVWVFEATFCVYGECGRARRREAAETAGSLRVCGFSVPGCAKEECTCSVDACAGAGAMCRT